MVQEGMAPRLVLCSSAKRTRSTLKKIRPALDEDAVTVFDEALYHAVKTIEWLLPAARPEPGRRLGTADRPQPGPGDPRPPHRPAAAIPKPSTGMAVKFPTGALAAFMADIGAWNELELHGAKLASCHLSSRSRIRFTKPLHRVTTVRIPAPFRN